MFLFDLTKFFLLIKAKNFEDNNYCQKPKHLSYPKMTSGPATVKTRFCLISDTHTQDLFPADDTKHAYREPLPSVDVLLHAGDITKMGYIVEYERMLRLLKKADAELKIVIAGNHDITLDRTYYNTIGKRMMHRNIAEDTDLIRDMWTGSEARAAGIVYLEEGIRTFELSNGARFTVRSHHQQRSRHVYSLIVKGLTSLLRSTLHPISLNSVVGRFLMSAMKIGLILNLLCLSIPSRHGRRSILCSHMVRHTEYLMRHNGMMRMSAASIFGRPSEDAAHVFTALATFMRDGERKGCLGPTRRNLEWLILTRQRP